MKRAVLAGAAVVLGASVALAQGNAPHAPMGPPPGPPPPYQLRPAYPAGDRNAAGGDGKVLFEAHCGYCHLAGGMGTNLVTKQQIMIGRTPDQGLLANRTDLTADYVKAVVRNGKGAMPTQTRVDITDAELDAVAKYLGKAG
ncbi:c-type cytochrome [Novosphingobium sp. SG720]|uniref:c-type cytochrome n=1 Tax=Novosphingobium TaxID=165696 RepID=UPI0014472E25|nr:cytochrome c [Novosphingobium sp. SG720]NKJ43397.1 mono/diheme cytochrome c family protein [Novosphingobium sp. SG720]